MPVIDRAWRLHAAIALPIISPAILLTQPAWADEAAAPAPGGDGLGDIVVTATRKETRLQSTPVAVSVIDEAFRSNQNVVTTRDLAGQIPGLYTPPSGITPLTNTFFIRGIGNSDPIFDPTVGVYIDDVYLPRAINGMSDLTDIERVEVLRGPQGTLFGANSAGGAIRYVTRTPIDSFDLRLDAGYGNYNTFNAHAYVAGALVPGLLTASVAFAHDEHEGYTWNSSLQRRVNNQNTDGGRIKLVLTPSDALRITLSADGTIDHSQAAQYIATTYNASNPAFTGLGAITGGTLFSPTQFSAFKDNVSYAGRYGINRSHSGGVTGRVDFVPEKVHGPDGIRNALEPFVASCSEIEWVIHHQVAQGATVMNERTDRFKMGDRWVELPVAGLFVLRDDKIALWRDYFDLGTFQRAMAS